MQAVRYGFLGTSDVPVWLALGVTAALAARHGRLEQLAVHTGHKLKP